MGARSAFSDPRGRRQELHNTFPAKMCSHYSRCRSASPSLGADGTVMIGGSALSGST